MNEDSELYAERLRAAYESEAPRPPADVVVPDAFWYVHFKAFAFLTVGPDQYRRQDAFRQPPENLSAARLHEVNRGCEQFLQFRGLSPARPLVGIGVDGFYALSRLFHFALVQQAALETNTADTILDKMNLRHVVDKQELTLYNLVDIRRPSEPGGDGTPCPYCGKLLRTAFAKQCRRCGMDWHDPANIINRKP